MPRAPRAAVLAALVVTALAGCAGAGAPASAPAPRATDRAAVPADEQAFAVLDRVAPAALRLDGGVVRSTACWTPSEHLLDDVSAAPPGTWKVLCRVYYRLRQQDRYQDASCIGDFDAQPMLRRCYVWKYHQDAPGFEDGARLASPPPTPLP